MHMSPKKLLLKGGYFFWSEEDKRSASIYRARVDGTDRKTVIEGQPTRLDFGVDSDRVYWASMDSGELRSAPLPKGTGEPASPTVASVPEAAPVELGPEDVGFVDTRGGAGWGDCCFGHLKSGDLGWAKAECDQAMKLNPVSPQPRASILYNEGLVEQKLGHADSARRFFRQSLALRPNGAVQAALDSLDAVPGK